MNLHESIKQVELFRELSSDTVDKMIERGTTRTVPAGGVVVKQGDRNSGFELVLDGTATVYVNDVEVASLRVGDYFGEMSLIDGAPRSATVISGPDGVRTFSISPLSFGELMDRQPEIPRLLLKVLATRIRRLESKTV